MIKNKIKTILRLLMYSGNNFQCPICGYSARMFLDAGLYVKRKNEKCPKCSSLTRHRHMWLFLEDYLKDKKDLKILHFAPEPPISEKLKVEKRFSYFTSQYDVQAKADFHIDLENIKLDNESFDLIICSHVLEHVTDDKKALSEMRRILRTGGLALIQVPLWPSESHPTYENPTVTDPRDRIIHFGQFDHLRIYGLDIVDKIKTEGFDVEVIDMEARYPLIKVEKMRLHNFANIRELIFVAKK